MRRFMPLVLVPLVLAACGGHAEQETQTTTTKNGVTTTTITDRTISARDARQENSSLSIDSDKFKANVEIPGMTLGSDHINLDGMKLYPGSTVKGMHVHAVDRPGIEKGQVVIDFSSPATPLAVAQNLANQAQAAGFALRTNTAAEVSGTKAASDGTHSFDATLAPNGNATVGALTMTGAEKNSGD